MTDKMFNPIVDKRHKKEKGIKVRQPPSHPITEALLAFRINPREDDRGLVFKKCLNMFK